MNYNLTKISNCLLCNSQNLKVFLNLGKIPVTNILSKTKTKNKIPNLKILICKNCWHAQVEKFPNATKTYINKYSYHTKFNHSMIEHFNKQINQIKKVIELKKKDLIIDIGGNDGILLNNFKIKKYKNLLNIDPSINATKNSQKLGIRSENMFFNSKSSSLIKKKYGIAKVIFSTNTLGNIDSLDDFINGVSNIMDENSIFVFENPYLLKTLQQTQFDTMYYEHVSYFSVTPLVKFFKSKNMELYKCIQTKIHGGSMMYFVRKKITNKPTKNINTFLLKEKKFKLNKITTYQRFEEKVKIKKNKIIKLLKKIRIQKKNVIAYGASDRGTVFMNYCKISNNEVDFIVDKNDKKIGYLSPGNDLRIMNLNALYKAKPDYVLLNAWNFKDEILEQFKRNGLKTKVILPFPQVNIINNY